MDRRKDVYKNLITLYINERDTSKLNEAIEEVKKDLIELNKDIEKSTMIDNDFVKRI
jgi:hypothetical protein